MIRRLESGPFRFLESGSDRILEGEPVVFEGLPVQYTEVEWSLRAAPAIDDAVYEFAVFHDGVLIPVGVGGVPVLTVIAPPGAIVTCRVFGPALSGRVEGPAIEQFVVVGPSNTPVEQVSGPALSHMPDGPAVMARTPDGPGLCEG